ncbi:MAG: hypoxanthine phosphoribosyltransferase [Desulfovermiculus sp.]|nr:hypoxanthine phosphoribosyltransferase [Desulfovermiculus sp.]
MPSAQMNCLFDSSTIAARVRELGAIIDRFYAPIQSPLVAVCVLKGAFMFFADLIRAIRTPVEADFVRLASYGQHTVRQEQVHFSKDIEVCLQNRHVLVVEDIVDTGHTVDCLQKVFQARNPASMAICSLIHKTGRREVDLAVDFYGFCLESGFVVGYGLDCAEVYRQLDAIYEIVQD